MKMSQVAFLLVTYLAFAVNNLSAIHINQSDWTSYKVRQGKAYDGNYEAIKSRILEQIELTEASSFQPELKLG